MKKNILLYGGIAVVLFGSALVLLLHRGGAESAEIYRNGVLLQSISLRGVAEPYCIELEGNRIEIAEGRIRMAEADCPDQLCVHQGWADSETEPIVCLPNRVMILPHGRKTADGVTG